MSVAFLYPLAWLAAVGIAAPVWLHLRRRQESNLVRFSAMQFLDEQPVARQRPLWPRDWWLLALRLLALILLVAAFAWPYLPTNQQPLVVRESRVYILDNTLSHQANGAFLKARDKLASTLRAAPPHVQFAVIELTATPRVIVRFGDDRLAAAELVRRLEPSHQRGSYLAAFRAAAALLDQSLGTDQRLVFLSDSQSNQWTEGLHSSPFLNNIPVELPHIEQTKLPNISVSEASVQRVFAGNVAIAECSVRVQHHGEVPSVEMVFLEGGREMLRRKLELAEQPESSTLLAQWPTEPSQWLRGEVRLEGATDPLIGDNRAYFSLAPLREGTVVVAAHSPYLRAALSPEVMAGRWKARFVSAANIAQAGENEPLADVLCLESSLLESSGARKLTSEYLRQNRGMLLILDQITPVVAGFLRELGIEADGKHVITSSPTGFRYTNMEHPVFQPFRSPNFGDLSQVRVDRFRTMSVREGVPLVFAESGEVLLFESTHNMSKLYVLAFSLDRQETNWPVHSTFVPFLDRCLTAAKSERKMPTQFEPGESCVWSLPESSEVHHVVLRFGEREVSRAPVEKGQARFQLPDMPGHYELCYEGTDQAGRLEPTAVFDVNPAPAESQLEYTSEVPVLASWMRDQPVESRRVDSLLEQLALTQPEILRQRVWWWLVLAGLAALSMETIWVAQRKELA